MFWGLCGTYLRPWWWAGSDFSVAWKYFEGRLGWILGVFGRFYEYLGDSWSILLETRTFCAISNSFLWFGRVAGDQRVCQLLTTPIFELLAWSVIISQNSSG